MYAGVLTGLCWLIPLQDLSDPSPDLPVHAILLELEREILPVLERLAAKIHTMLQVYCPLAMLENGGYSKVPIPCFAVISLPNCVL